MRKKKKNLRESKIIDAVFVKKLLLEFIQFKHKVEGEELKKMTADKEEWDIFDASAHVHPKRRRVTLVRDEGGEPQKKATSTVSRSGDGDVVLSLGEVPQFSRRLSKTMHLPSTLRTETR